MNICYTVEPELTENDFVELLRRSGLAERRPVHDREKMEAMLKNADLIVTARLDQLLVGVARSITDFNYALYCSELAVDLAHQSKGIGKGLLEETIKQSPNVTNHILLSAPGAISFYEHAGFPKHPAAFLFNQSKQSDET